MLSCALNRLTRLSLAGRAVLVVSIAIGPLLISSQALTDEPASKSDGASAAKAQPSYEFGKPLTWLAKEFKERQKEKESELMWERIGVEERINAVYRSDERINAARRRTAELNKLPGVIFDKHGNIDVGKSLENAPDPRGAARSPIAIPMPADQGFPSLDPAAGSNGGRSDEGYRQRAQKLAQDANYGNRARGIDQQLRNEEASRAAAMESEIGSGARGVDLGAIGRNIGNAIRSFSQPSGHHGHHHR